MKNLRCFFIIISFLCCGSIFAQLQIDRPIQLNGSSAADRKIQGIQTVAGSEDAVNVDAVQKNSLLYGGIATGSSGAYIVSLSPAPSGTTLTTGMVIQFIANSSTTSSGASLTITGLTPATVPIMKNYNSSLLANDIQTGQAVSVIYDGSNFQMLSQLGNGSTSAGGSSNLNFAFVDTLLILGWNQTQFKGTVVLIPGQGTDNLGTSVTLTCSYISGHNAPVTFSISGMPTGVTYHFTPGGGFPDFGSILAFNASASAPIGSYPLVVTASDGATSQPVNIILDIVPVKRAFVSSIGYTGNLGGLSGADNQCNSLANAAGLGGLWVAWLSTSTINAKDRLTDAEFVDVSIYSDIIALGINGLITNKLFNSLHITEQGGWGNYYSVWTGTQDGGVWSNSVNCNDWTDGSSSVNGIYGVENNGSAVWTVSGTQSCDNLYPIYCFEK